MTIDEAVYARHSVRRYIHRPLEQETIEGLQAAIDDCNREGRLHIQLVTNETRALSGPMSYGKFSGVENYLVMAGQKADDLDERIGYYGEKLVLIAQQMGLNTCWAGLTYRKVDSAFRLEKGEKVACLIALGYGETQGVSHRIKSVQKVSNAGDLTPEWFNRGVEFALLAPTAVNQQKFFLEFAWPDGDRGRQAKVRISRSFSIVGYTRIDMGIAKLHFEIGAGKDNFIWGK